MVSTSTHILTIFGQVRQVRQVGVMFVSVSISCTLAVSSLHLLRRAVVVVCFVLSLSLCCVLYLCTVPMHRAHP